DELLNVIARLTVPFPADWTMVHLVSDEGMAQAVASEHVDPGCQRVLAGLVRSASGPLSPGSMLAEVVAAGQLAIATSAATDLTDYLLGPSCRAAVEDLRTGSAAMLPFAIDGRVKAVLSMISHNPAKFTGAGALIVEDVARRI